MSDRETDALRTHQADLSGREAQFNKDLGANIQRARVQAGMTQGDLAAEVRVSRGSIANLERGAQAPTAYRLQTIADALHCDLADLFPQVRADISPAFNGLSESHSESVQRVLQSVGVRE